MMPQTRQQEAKSTTYFVIICRKINTVHIYGKMQADQIYTKLKESLNSSHWINHFNLSSIMLCMILSLKFNVLLQSRQNFYTEYCY